MRNGKVIFSHIALVSWRGGKRTRPLSHLVAVDTRGRIWERYSDMDAGKWGCIESPNEPATNRRARERKR